MNAWWAVLILWSTTTKTFTYQKASESKSNGITFLQFSNNTEHFDFPPRDPFPGVKAQTKKQTVCSLCNNLLAYFFIVIHF